MHRKKWVIWLNIGLIVISGIIILKKKLNLGLDLKGGVALVLEIDTLKLPEAHTMRDVQERAIEVIRNRIDSLGVAEPIIQGEGEKWITVQLPGLHDPKRAKDIIGKTALLEFKFLDEQGNIADAQQGKIPEGDELLYGEDGVPYLLKKEAVVTGAALSDASMIPSGAGEFGTEPYVSIKFNSEGTKIFSQVTAANVGKRLAIVLDGVVHSAPVIRDHIADGSAMITGRFTTQTARDLAIVLRAGALPVPINIISENTVGPTLGKDSIDKGTKASFLGAILVVLFMAIYYKKSGVIADIGVLVNVLVLLAGLSLMNATLTLPGIAGIILTIGMSVDSNVLIFERIREEIRAGRTVRASIDAGYRHAMVTIIDSHVTTLITAAVLFMLGTGPIKGFAVTLSVGVAISLFTAVVTTKVIFDWRTSRAEVKTLSI